MKKKKETKEINRKLPEGSTKGGTKAIYPVKENGKLATGKPTKKTEAVLNKLQFALERGCTEREACAYAGIKQQTLVNWKNDDKELVEQIEAWKDLYVQQIKFKSFDRAMNEKNRDSTDILFKIDKRYSDKVDANVTGQFSLVKIAQEMQQKRLEREKGEE